MCFQRLDMPIYCWEVTLRVYGLLYCSVQLPAALTSLLRRSFDSTDSTSEFGIGIRFTAHLYILNLQARVSFPPTLRANRQFVPEAGASPNSHLGAPEPPFGGYLTAFPKAGERDDQAESRNGVGVGPWPPRRTSPKWQLG